jgi:hypothetical protein
VLQAVMVAAEGLEVAGQEFEGVPLGRGQRRPRAYVVGFELAGACRILPAACRMMLEVCAPGVVPRPWPALFVFFARARSLM